MSTTSKLIVGGTEYDLRDADAQEQLTQLKSDFDAIALSVVDGAINITFEESEEVAV